MYFSWYVLLSFSNIGFTSPEKSYPIVEGANSEIIDSYANPVTEGFASKYVFNLYPAVSEYFIASSWFMFKKNVSIGFSQSTDKYNSGLPLYPKSNVADLSS